GRRDFPRGNGNWKIPRRNEAHNPKRLPVCEEQIIRQIVRQGLAANGVTYPAEEPENIDGPLHLARTFGERLALLTREQLREFSLATLQNLRRLAQNPTARHCRSRRPARKCLGGSGNRILRILASSGSKLGDGFAAVSRVVILISLA